MPDESADRDKILDKIAKAIALSESEKELGNLEAAENAASIAARMMLEHNLSAETVKARDTGKDKIKFYPYIPKDHDDHAYIRETPWLTKLAAIVAHAFNCRMCMPNDTIQHVHGYNSFLFVGYKVDTDLTVHYFSLLSRALAEAVDKEYRRAFHRAYRNGTHMSISNTNWRKNFLVGAIDGLIYRFEAIRGDVIKHAPDSGTALTIIKQNFDAIDKLLSGLKELEAPDILPPDQINRNALIAGLKWADEVPLSAPLKQAKSKHILPNT